MTEDLFVDILEGICKSAILCGSLYEFKERCRVSELTRSEATKLKHLNPQVLKELDQQVNSLRDDITRLQIQYQQQVQKVGMQFSQAVHTMVSKASMQPSKDKMDREVQSLRDTIKGMREKIKTNQLDLTRLEKRMDDLVHETQSRTTMLNSLTDQLVHHREKDTQNIKEWMSKKLDDITSTSITPLQKRLNHLARSMDHLDQDSKSDPKPDSSTLLKGAQPLPIGLPGLPLIETERRIARLQAKAQETSKKISALDKPSDEFKSEMGQLKKDVSMLSDHVVELQGVAEGVKDLPPKLETSFRIIATKLESITTEMSTLRSYVTSTIPKTVPTIPSPTSQNDLSSYLEVAVRNALNDLMVSWETNMKQGLNEIGEIYERKCVGMLEGLRRDVQELREMVLERHVDGVSRFV
ncbi:uncharacterized protein SPPG_07319 [Spizellomyces punctatus DAOM BR117]|uniref:Uncharacterized protein n=1 Tax=Spizellomyces punctatus (strain DAOM BR117) TaxID=645134 RepID=A0A0L0H833_SPIPD|nr:uncharacterized protein SPPG_07319 [Spizellomyces punctatus DAOM BR117]KNC97392.1 hypothetical protein SPPG_07319 [Spizellomyces punctatus DAOM BR117]|eukprot:XP_016605432.1 hypothetical protein SPPG_07319 [Spizellomyces punctatus DAOM BR117]